MPTTIANQRVLLPRDVMTVILIPWQVDVTAGVAKEQIRMQRAYRIQELAASLAVASSSGPVTIDMNVNGVSVLTTKLTIDEGEKTSRTAAIPYVLTGTDFALDDEFSWDVDTAGTGAAGLKFYLVVWQL